MLLEDKDFIKIDKIMQEVKNLFKYDITEKNRKINSYKLTNQ